MGFIGVFGPKEFGFLVVLSIKTCELARHPFITCVCGQRVLLTGVVNILFRNRASILAISVSNRVWFCALVLTWEGN